MSKESKIKNLLVQTVGKTYYNGWSNRTTYGYHSYDLQGINIQGQRNPKERINNFSKYINFSGKTIVDFGCNVGAMLHHIPDIKKGIGFDYDKNCVSAANQISKILNLNNLNFFNHDFDKDSYSNLEEKLPEKIDVVFLLSLGSWVKSWGKLYQLCVEKSDTIILEVNNVKEGESQLNFFSAQNKKIVEITNQSEDDSTGNFKRKTYILS